MNKALRELYSKHWENLSNGLSALNDKLEEGEQASNPLLIQLPDEEVYQSADIRLMVFGQETNNWHREFQPDMEKTLNWYSEFIVARRHKGKGTFWNGARRFKKQLETECPGKQVELVWNNVFKIGKTKKGKPGPLIRRIEELEFNVIEKEIDILKPNLIVFLSGPYYDRHLKKKVSLEENIWIDDDPYFGKVVFYSVGNGIQAVRTYHPTYLRRSKQEKEIFDYIIEILPKVFMN